MDTTNYSESSEPLASLSHVESETDEGQGGCEGRPIVSIQVGQEILLNTGAEDAWVDARVVGQTDEGAWKAEYIFRGRPRIMTIFPSRVDEMVQCAPQAGTPSSPSSSLRATAGAVELPLHEFPSPPREAPRLRQAPCAPAATCRVESTRARKPRPAQLTNRCNGLSSDMVALANKMDCLVLHDRGALVALADELSAVLADAGSSSRIGNFQAAVAKHKLSSIESALQTASQALQSESQLAASRIKRIADSRARSNSRGGLTRLEPSRARPVLMSH
mmetsp:Transcript_29052/g.52923  ORF Transcript_29052/g.52923 Transcript_29052/m.52923 type:complete len:276 (-) Transcript_29052:32-859(-)